MYFFSTIYVVWTKSWRTRDLSVFGAVSQGWNGDFFNGDWRVRAWELELLETDCGCDGVGGGLYFY